MSQMSPTDLQQLKAATEHDDEAGKLPAGPSDRSDEELLRDEAQTERQAPDNAGPGEAAGR